MNFRSIVKPEYYLRPGQAFKRVAQVFQKLGTTERTVMLPWRVPIQISPSDEIGCAILKTGIYDLILTEVLFRTIKKGAICFDVGAHIGYATSIMLKQAGNLGRVVAFEPHPDTFQRLNKNANLWASNGSLARLKLEQVGLSNSTGTKSLNIPPGFVANSGMSHFYDASDKPSDSSCEIEVPCTTLDAYCRENDIQKIDLLKIDVEGHELQMLDGASELLNFRKISCIIFEDSRAHWRTPSELNQDFAPLFRAGYSVFRLKRGAFGVKYEDLAKLFQDRSSVWRFWEPPNFIAIPKDSPQISRLKKLGWYSLRGGGKL